MSFSLALMSTRKHIERFQLDTLLARITRLGYVAPTSISDFERPDFVLELGGRKIGLEATFAVYQEYVRGQKLHRRMCPDQCIATSDLRDGDRRRSNDEIVHDMLTVDGPWIDCEEEMAAWRDKIADSLESKRGKLNETDFHLFDENWLLIYDDPPLAEDAFTYDRACRHLAGLFSAPATTSRDFDTVFIHSGRYLFRFNRSRLTLSYQHS